MRERRRGHREGGVNSRGEQEEEKRGESEEGRRERGGGRGEGMETPREEQFPTSSLSNRATVLKETTGKG